MHGCARGPSPEGRWGGRSNPPLGPRGLAPPIEIEKQKKKKKGHQSKY